MTGLTQELMAMIRQRIADPARRNDKQPTESLGSTTDPQDIFKLFEGQGEGSGEAFGHILDQMRAWGQSMPEMHMSRGADGSVQASSESPDLPVAAPAAPEDVAALRQAVGMPLPEDLVQLLSIADGGWGPGQSYTSGHGQGLLSARGMIANYEDLRRRGPGYTGEADWPPHYLPITDLMGPVSYDLSNGEIVRFDDYWYDNDRTIAEAFTISHRSLQDFLTDWLSGELEA